MHSTLNQYNTQADINAAWMQRSEIMEDLLFFPQERLQPRIDTAARGEAKDTGLLPAQE
jgi:hypothetical protein